jgi:Zn-dependent peptidase ImmA (M78 family)
MNETSTNTNERRPHGRRRMPEDIYPTLLAKVKPVVDGVKAKFGIEPGKFKMQDFFGICWGEGIEVAEGLDFEFMAEHKAIRGCHMRMPNGVTVIYLRYFFDHNEPNPTRTAAHELGHYFLGHRGPLDLREGKASKYSRTELEADLFAELLLAGE